MRCLCLGGSFNPIHHGHVGCVETVARLRSFDKVLLIPAMVSPHKTLNQHDLAPPDDRLAMCRLAVAERAEQIACEDVQCAPILEVDDLELRRPPPSYTIDTIRALRSRGWGEVHWLIGADQVATLPKWHESLGLLGEATILIVQRPGYEIDWGTLPEPYRRLQENVVEAPLMEISSSDIRRRVREGRPITGLVADAVADYIHERGLYRST